MAWIDLPFTITSPMFCGRGGKAGPIDDSFRITELRGALAFWFRAMVGPGLDTKDLLGLEEEIFGRASGNQTYLPSVRFRMGSAVKDPVSPLRPAVPENKYLAGLGLSERKPILAYSTGEVRVSLPWGEDDKRTKAVAASFWALGALGGVGARVRRGYGGFNVDPEALRRMWCGLPDNDKYFWHPKHAVLTATNLRAHYLNERKQLEEFSSRPMLTEKTWSCAVSRPLSKNVIEALARSGKWFREERTEKRESTYKDGKPVKGKERWTPEYRDHLCKVIGGNAHFEPESPTMPIAAFGLPILFINSAKKKGELNINDGGRRPSLVWLRCQKFGEDYHLVAHAFKENFAPGDRGIFATDDKKLNVKFDNRDLWSRAETLLEAVPEFPPKSEKPQ